MRSQAPAILALGAAAVAFGLVGCGGGGDGSSVEATIEVDRTPAGIAAGEGAVWVTAVNGDTLARIDPATNEVRAEIPVGDSPEGVTTGDGFVWVVNQGDGTLSKIDPASNEVVDTVRLGEAPGQGPLEEALGLPDRSFLEGFDELAFGEGAVWAVGTDGLARVDPESLEVTTWSPEQLDLGQVVGSPSDPDDVAAGGGRVWLSVAVPNDLFAFDPATGQSERQVGGGDGVAFGEDAVWTLYDIDGELIRSEPLGDITEESEEIEVGEDPDDVAVGEGAVWVPLSDGRLAKVDPSSLDVEEKVSLPEGEYDDDLSLRVAAGEGAVWVASRTEDRVVRISP